MSIPMDESTQLNHWIALMAELEEAKEKIAKAVYKHYKAGRVTDDYTLECCRRLDDLYKGAKDYEEYLKEDFKAYTESEGAKSGKLAQVAGAKAASFISKLYIKYNVNTYKRNFREQFLDLGQRVISAAEEGRSICPAPQVMQWCVYATRIKKEADMRWEEITILHREQVKGNAFLATIKQFMINFSSFFRTNGGPLAKKVFRANEQAVTKLRSQYKEKIAGKNLDKI